MVISLKRSFSILTAAAVVALGSVLGAAELPTDGLSPRMPAAPGARLGAVDPRPDTFGTGTSILRFPPSAFYPSYQDGATTYSYYVMARYMSAGYGDFVAPLQLPSGAKILGVELNAYDSTSANNVCALLGIGTPSDGQGLNYGGPCTTGSSGNQTVYQDFSAQNLTVDNLGHMYEISVSFGVMDQTNRLNGVAVYYQLQVSPAPAVASFVDVPTTSPIFKFVEALKASGITAGCDATHFCPNSNITRGQMAVFLAAALGLQWE